MISKECKITISGNTASIDSEIYLYKNDMNIKYLFNIVNSEYAYTKDSTLDNIINANKASYAQIKFKKEDIEIDFDVQETSNGKAILLIKKELIDEETELGDYTIQIRLFDESKTSVITLPPVNNCIHIMRPIFEKVDGSTNVVDEAAVDEAIVTYAEPVASTNEDGTFAKKTWVPKEKITTAELNRMEEGISYVNSQYKDIANKVDNITVDNITLDNINGVQNHNQVNLFDATKCEDFFYDYKGNKTTALNGSVMSNWIPCKAGDKITRNGIATNVVCYFKEDKTFIKRVDSYGLSTITVPNNSEIAYVRLAVQVAKDRKIAYGEYIIPDNEIGDYYTIPKLKVKEDNLAFTIGVLTSPDGTTWRIKVDNAGVLSTENMGGIIPDSQLPSDFLKYTVTGQSTDNEDFLVAPHTDNNNMGYIFVMNYKGDVKWYKKLPAFAYNFRKYKNKAGQFRYTYMQVKNTDKMSTQGGYDNGYIVVMDEKFKVIIPSVKLLTHGSITETSYPNENHDYMYIDDNHYILSCYHPKIVTNIPGLEGTEIKVNNCILQEQKDGKVLWQWESANYPELYTSSHYNNEFSKYVTSQNVYTDYCHLNSVQFAPDGNILLSARSIGIMKVDKSTNKLMWVMGRGKVPDSVKLKGYTAAQAPYCQHDARYQDDGTITCFDNSGCSTNNVRIPV